MSETSKPATLHRPRGHERSSWPSIRVNGVDDTCRPSIQHAECSLLNLISVLSRAFEEAGYGIEHLPLASQERIIFGQRLTMPRDIIGEWATARIHGLKDSDSR